MGNSFAGEIDFYSYIMTSPFGFIGHTCSLITFSSKTLRVTSIGFLFICLTISDLLYLFFFICDFLQDINVSILRSEELCRSRAFVINFSSVTSAWLLVLIAIDRLIRIRFPFRHARLCTRKMAACMTAMICLYAIVFTYHVLQRHFAFSSRTSIRCGPVRSPPTEYSIFYYNTWPTLQLIVTYVLPGTLMILILIGIYTKMRERQTVFVGLTRREKQQRQMLILMISSVAWFLICTLPCGIFRIITQRSGITPSTLLVTDILEIFRNMNYCYNFYIHCLTSQLFRNTFIQQCKRFPTWCKRRRGLDNTTVYPLTTVIRPRVLPTANEQTY